MQQHRLMLPKHMRLMRLIACKSLIIVCSHRKLKEFVCSCQILFLLPPYSSISSSTCQLAFLWLIIHLGIRIRRGGRKKCNPIHIVLMTMIQLEANDRRE